LIGIFRAAVLLLGLGRSRRSSSSSCGLLIVTLSLALLPTSLASARDGVFNPDTFTLDNGMQVVVVPNHRVPVVTHMVWYKVGSADEPPGHSGIAHLLEHLMFKGTETFGPGEFSGTVARIGGQENAFTSFDYTAYYQSVAKERLEQMMEMEADRMTNLALTEDQVKSELLVVLEERNQRVENNPSAILGERAAAVQFMNHPYRRPIIGWEHEIAELERSEVLEFYKQWYAPNNAVLIVAGDVTAEEVRPLAEKYYGTIPAAPDIRRHELRDPPQRTSRRVTLRDQRVRQPEWSRSYIVPSYRTGPSDDVYGLEVLSQILGGGSTSRLYRQLVVDDALATSAGAWYNPSRRGPARMSLYASPRPGVTLEQIEDAMESVLQDLIRDGVTDAEIERAKNGKFADVVYARDSLSTGARVLGEALAIGLSVDDVEEWPERIRAVTKAQIDAVAKQVFGNTHSVTALLQPEEAPAPEPSQ